MTNMDAYQSDLNEILGGLSFLAVFAPEGDTKKARTRRAIFNSTIDKIRTTVSLMKDLYIPMEGHEQ